MIGVSLRNLNDLEMNLCRYVSKEELKSHVINLTQFNRLTGTEDFNKAVDYIVSKLNEYGVPYEVHEPELYVSQPEFAEVHIIEPAVEQRVLESFPLAFSASSPNGVEGDVVYVARLIDVESSDVRNKIVLTDLMPAIDEFMPKARLIEDVGGKGSGLNITLNRF